MSLTPQWMDELRSRITLSGVIGRTTRVQKAGREFKACCPFHNEKTPSFTINDEKGFYHCFGCGAHGDVIRWMTDQRGMSFMDAVKSLAEEAGMEVPAPDPRLAAVQAERAKAEAGLHDVMAAAQAWFVERLASDEGAKARAYLATRGFDARTVREFGFGYAPEGRQALKAALPQFAEGMLVEAGLRIVVEGEDGQRREPYDRFRGRLMLPICDVRGRVIAFGGRILDAEKKDAPKYLNSPDTPLFDKGRTLYNLHRAGPVARQSGRLIVVEGYMDAIAMAAAGIGECVAPLGTALTEQQIALLWRVEPMPILCFDGDKAGQRAAMRAAVRAMPLLKPGHTLRIVTLPDGQDPDDLLKQRGRGAMEALLEAPTGLVDLVWAHERDAGPLDNPEAKAALKGRLMAHADTIADPDIKALYRREWLARFSDFAFPAREQRPFTPRPDGPRFAGGRFPRRDVPPPRPLPGTMATLDRRETGQHANMAAVAQGLLRFPQEIPALIEDLHELAQDSAEIDAMLAAAETGAPLEMQAMPAISADGQPVMRTSFRRQGMEVDFSGDNSDGQELRVEFGRFVRMLAQRRRLERATRAAFDRYENEMSEEAEAEHRRIAGALADFVRENWKSPSDSGK